MSNRIRLKVICIVAIIATLGLSTGQTTSANRETTTAQSLPEMRGEAAVNHLKQAGLYDSLAEAMQATRYQIKEWAGGYSAANPAQGYLTSFTAEGIEVRAADRGQSGWRMGMRLSGYGYGQRKVEVGPGRLTASNNEVRYERRATADGANKITEWYVNRPSGMEQGFTIPTAPGEKAAGERLTLWLELGGDLEAKLDGSGAAITLSGGGAALRYDQLYAYDARGRALGARMSLTGREIRLEVEDETAVYPVTIDPHFTEEAKLLASDAAGFDLFGNAVAIHGETVVAGAPDANDHSGAAYVFVRSGTMWSQQAKLTASDAAADARFGESVAIHGETVVVGTNPFFGVTSGAAYVFVRSGTMWSQQAKLTASDAAVGDHLGTSVAIHGETVVAGAPDADDPVAGGDSGAAYVFVRSGTMWSQQAKLTASDAAEDDLFSWSVAIHGETVVAGARGDNDPVAGIDSGAAYVFVRSGTMWSQQAKLTASDAADGDTFGWSVAIHGETVVAGARFADDPVAGGHSGAAYVFVRSGTMWSQQANLTASDAAANDIFGESVAIHGETVVVGAPFAGDPVAGVASGAAYVFVRSGTMWSQHQKLTATDAASIDQFGNAVAIHGETVVAGARFADDPVAGTNSGAAYVFAATMPGYDSSPAPGSTINVGSATVGSFTSANLTVSETGDATLEVTSHSLSGPNASDFSVSPATLTAARRRT